MNATAPAPHWLKPAVDYGPLAVFFASDGGAFTSLGAKTVRLQVTDDPGRLRAQQLGRVGVLLLRHDR